MLLQNIVETNYQVFKKIVKNAREIEEETIKSFCQFKQLTKIEQFVQKKTKSEFEKQFRTIALLNNIDYEVINKYSNFLLDKSHYTIKLFRKNLI